MPRKDSLIQKRLLILDANVLIDYAKSEPDILRLTSKHIGRINVPSVIFDEVEDLILSQIGPLGITLIEPDGELLIRAANRIRGLSFQDRICLFMAKSKPDSVCVTNEKLLRKICKRENVEVLWGLQLMLLLVQKGVLTDKQALKIARKIHALNPFITDQLIQRFSDKLRENS